MNINVEQLCTEYENIDVRNILEEIINWKKDCSYVVANVLDSVLDIIINNMY